MKPAENTLRQIEEILPQLDLPQLRLVLAFAEFVRERISSQNEDEILWSFVEQEQAYRAAHPQDVSIHDSDESLLAALDASS